MYIIENVLEVRIGSSLTVQFRVIIPVMNRYPVRNFFFGTLARLILMCSKDLIKVWKVLFWRV